MKLTRSRRSGQRGFLLALVCIIVAVVIIGYTTYRIIKCLKKMPPRTLPPESAELQTLTSNAVAQLALELQQAFPGEPVSVQSAALMFVPVFVPFGTNNVPVMIQCSTNLIDWLDVGTMLPGESFGDTNLYDAMFYRAFDAHGVSVPPSTNAGFQWREAK